jgi:hypothetical protein
MTVSIAELNLKVAKHCHPEAVFPRGIFRDGSVLNEPSWLFYENRSSGLSNFVPVSEAVPAKAPGDIRP